MAGINLLTVDFESTTLSQLDTIAETYDDKLVDLFIENIKTNYNFTETEVELRSFQNIYQYGGISNTLNKHQFNLLVEFFDNHDGFTEKGFPFEKNTLDISIHSSNVVDNRDDISNLRFTIENQKNIKKFCSDNNIPKNCKTIYKARYNWNPALSKNIESLNDTYKFRREIHGKKIGLQSTNGTVDLYSTRMRLGGKLEIPYVNYTTKLPASLHETNKGRGNDIFHISKASNDILLEIQKNANLTMKKYTDRVKQAHGSHNLFKTFRLKDRNSYEFKDSNGDVNIRIDLTKVKSSKQDIDTKYNLNSIPVKKFYESEIIEQNEHYEFEIEIINVTTLNPDQLRNTINIARNIAKYSNRIVNERIDGFTHTNISDDVTYVYKKLIQEMLIVRLENNIAQLIDIKTYRNTLHKLALIGEEEDDSELLQIKADIDERYNKYSYFNRFSTNTKDISKEESKLNKIIKDIRDEKDKYRNDKFLKISPKVVSISMDHVREENIESIISGYSVTDKADGLANILYKLNTAHLSDSDKSKYQYLNDYIFLIDSNLKVYNTEMQIVDGKLSIIFNGEYLNYDKNRKMINKYGVYDAYIFDNKDICEYPLVSLDPTMDTRIQQVKTYLNPDDLNITRNPFNLNIFAKKFLIPSVTESIFKCTKDIWTNYTNGLTEYKLDGTIYTPINEPVGYKADRIDYYLNQGLTWFRNLKWKPSEDNTIDFLVRFEKEEVSKFRDQTIYKNKIRNIKSSNGSYDKYIIGNLYNTGFEKTGYNPCTQNSKVNFGKVKPIKFKPPKPLIKDIHYGLFKINTDLRGDPVLDLEGDKVEDDTIIEVNYTNFNASEDDYEPTQNKRFNILRTRHDKTYTHRIATNKQKEIFKIIKKCIKIIKSPSTNPLAVNFVYKNRYLFSIREIAGNLKNVDKDVIIDRLKHKIKEIDIYYKNYSDVTKNINVNYGNSVDVANNIWMSIYNPVTIEIITTGNGIPDIAAEEKKYYNRKDNRKRDKSITIELQNFHNKIIKRRILLGNVCNEFKLKGITNISLLDLSCGKGGDIAKWRDCGITNCVGIDISINNIIDPIDGACERYNFYKKKKLKNMTHIDFLVGDSSKNMSVDSFTIPAYISKYNQLWNEEKGPNYSKNKFNIISLMFSLHYFFKDRESIDNLIENISANIADNGYLIGACFNGKKIFDYLRDLNINEDKSAYKEGKVIWKIIKKYSNSTFDNDDDCLGIPIKVYMYSINKVIEEYLVNFDYFKTKLSEHNIDVLESDDMKNMMLPKNSTAKLSIGSFEDIFNNLTTFSQNNKYKGPFEINSDLYNNLNDKLSEGEKTISFFSTYFIFKKRTGSSLTAQIRQFILKNKDTRGYKTHFNNKKWDKLKVHVFKEFTNLDLSNDNSLHNSAYDKATAIISTDALKQTGTRKLKIDKPKKPKVKLIVATSATSSKTVNTSKRPIILNIKKKKALPTNDVKIVEGRNKMQKILKQISDKIANGKAAGLLPKINSIISIFNNPPYKDDDEIKSGIAQLEVFKTQLN